MVAKGEVILLPEAPQIDGLSFRHFQGKSDYPKMIDVLQESKDTDQIEEVDSLEVLSAKFAHLNHCNPYQDMLFVEIGARVIGFSQVYWEDATHTGRRYVHEGYLVPVWRGKGIGWAMLNFNEKRILEIASTHAQDEPGFFQVKAANSEVAKTQLLQDAGYRPVRYFCEMVRPDLENIPHFALPPGLEIRPVLPEHYRPIWEANNEAMGDHWDHVDYSEEDYQFWLQGDEEFQPELWKIAWDIATNQVAGMVLGFIDEDQNTKFNRKRGWTEDICVRRPWRNRGLAHALIIETLREFKSRGMTESALNADTENLSGAFQLYESLGFRTVKTTTVYQKPIGSL